MTAEQVRDDVEEGVRDELFGPSINSRRRGKPIRVVNNSLVFDSHAQSKGIWHDEESGEEIVAGLLPRNKYGVGVLFQIADEGSSSTRLLAEGAETELMTGEVESAFTASGGLIDQDDDFDLAETQSRKPSALAITALIGAAGPAVLHFQISGATYRKISVSFRDGSKVTEWWLREPFVHNTDVLLSDLLAQKSPRQLDLLSDGPSYVSSMVHFRSSSVKGGTYLTAVIANGVRSNRDRPEVFQARISMRASGAATFLPYFDELRDGPLDEEAEEMRLLYRGRQTYGVGHGCSAEWSTIESACVEVRSESLPSYETFGITPNVEMGGASVDLQMSSLALTTRASIGATLEPLVGAYVDWLVAKRKKIGALRPSDANAANRLLARADVAVRRMQEGLALLGGEDPNVFEAFKAMNIAMAAQQVNVGKPTLLAKGGAQKLFFEAIDVEPIFPTWRPFQIAFLLMSIAGLSDGKHDDRRVVDLIFFPTGGGKTEAYLGAAAFQILLGRLRSPADSGVSVIMRYTLRLLSTQQFQRSAALICALELIRSADVERYGSDRIALGLWVGKSVSPNSLSEARRSFSALIKSPLQKPNPFILDKCPHCGAEMGVSRSLKEVIGYEVQGNRVAYVCRNIRGRCPFSNSQRPLPIYVVDEDIYTRRPTFVIATVDKFAMMSRRPEARAIFNRDASGARLSSPPSLIIQDELHLITGPLGSMVGLYEAIIEDLCSIDLEDGSRLSPKIIGATATIRRYSEQIRSLYGRDSSFLFPPQELEADEGFFARVDRRANGLPTAGRKYLGVYASGYSSMQTTQVRVAVATSQTNSVTNPDHPNYPDSDPYWTSVSFFNSLRELGNTVSLVQSDIPDFLQGLVVRGEVESARWPRRVIELTSRRESDQIPLALRELEQHRSSNKAVDMCLASSIMEVGVDVSRLSLLSIVGQPKTTAQYIQVSGRVGRRGPAAPGLVITLYSTMRSRDRSHYERFRTYHQSLYSQVEPGSVTSFAIPTLKRALHGAIISYIRMNGDSKARPTEFPEELFDQACRVLMSRVRIVDPDSVTDVETAFEQVRRTWVHAAPVDWEYRWDVERHYGSPLTDVERALMRGRSDPIYLAGAADPSMQTPTSMRAVDAESNLVTGGNPYLAADVEYPEGA